MAQSYQTSLLNVASSYIKYLQVPVTQMRLKKQLEENPFYPSLFSLSSTFERLNIPHTAFTLEKENFDHITPPFIAYLKNQSTGKDFVLVTKSSNNEVSYIAENKKITTLSKESFLDSFEKIILLAGDIDDSSGEKDYQINRKKEIRQANRNRGLAAAGVFTLIAVIYFSLIPLPFHFIAGASTLLVVKLLGLAVSVLLLIFEIDKSNAFVKSICTSGKKTNCNAVFASKASRIFGMSWSEAGFFYFASTFLFLLFPAIDFSTKIFVLAVANMVAAPYIIFSVYYQWKVVKQWCPLCLAIQGILTAELIWSVAFFWQDFYLPESALAASSILSMGVCLALPVTLWYALKPLFVKAKNESVYKGAYRRLLYNPDTFNHLLQQQPTAPTGYENLGITVGNPDAANTIIKVCNPYCGPCAKAHALIDEILHQNMDVKLKLILTASNDKNDERGMVARHLLAISKKYDALQTTQALDDWYLSNQKEYASFAEKYPMNGELKEQEAMIAKMSAWCEQAEITGTPTIYINGKRLPETYRIEELRYLL